MSRDFYFWKGPHVENPDQVCEQLLEGEAVLGVEKLDKTQVERSLAEHLVGWKQNANMWAYPDFDADDTALVDVAIYPCIVSASCSWNMQPDQLNQIIDAMLALDLPLYDPQVEERFD